MKVVVEDKPYTFELKPVWRCTNPNCRAVLGTSGFQGPEDMNAFSWENGAPKHACRPGSHYSPCELVIVIDAEKFRKALGVKRAPGKPVTKEMDVQA